MTIRDRQQRRVPEPPKVDHMGLQTWLNAAADATNALAPQSTFSRDTPESHISAIPGTLGSNIQGGTAWVKLSGDTTVGWASLATAGDVTKLEEDTSAISSRVESLEDKGYGGFGVTGGDTEQGSIPDYPSMATLTGWTFEMPVNGTPLNITSNRTAATLTFTKAGVWAVWGQFSFSGDANTEFYIHIYKNSTITQGGTNRKLGASGDVGSCSVTGIGTFAVGDFVVPKVGVVTGAGDALTLTEAQFWAQLLDV